MLLAIVRGNESGGGRQAVMRSVLRADHILP